MAFKVVNFAVAGLVSSIFLYSSYFLYSYKTKKKVSSGKSTNLRDTNYKEIFEFIFSGNKSFTLKGLHKNSLKNSENKDHDYDEIADKSFDLYSLNAKTTDGGTLTAAEVESLLSKLDITDMKLLERILITISNLASFSCNHVSSERLPFANVNLKSVFNIPFLFYLSLIFQHVSGSFE